MASANESGMNIQNPGNFHSEAIQWNGNNVTGNIYFAPPPDHKTNNTLPSLIGIPLRRDAYFIEREIVNKIFDRWTIPGAAVAIWGLAGNGKTYIAAECCYRAEKKYQDQRWIFWIQGTSWAAFVESFKDVASALDIDLPTNLGDCHSAHARDFLRRLRGRLSGRRYGHWLLVLDIPHYDLPHIKEMAQYLPTSLYGSTLIITRCRTSIDEFHIQDDNDIFRVGAITDSEAIALLQQRINCADRTIIKQLPSILGCSPLALSHIATYISGRAPYLALPNYLSELMKDSNHTDFIADIPMTKHSYLRDHAGTTMLLDAWHDTFTSLTGDTKLIFAVMSVLASTRITTSLLQKIFEIGLPGLEMHKTLLDLSTHDLISISSDGSAIPMPRLVSLSYQKWFTNIAIPEVVAEFAQRAAIALLRAIPVSEDLVLSGSANAHCVEELSCYIPHIKAVVDYSSTNQRHWSNILHQLELRTLRIITYLSRSGLKFYSPFKTLSTEEVYQKFDHAKYSLSSEVTSTVLWIEAAQPITHISPRACSVLSTLRHRIDHDNAAWSWPSIARTNSWSILKMLIISIIHLPFAIIKGDASDDVFENIKIILGHINEFLSTNSLAPEDFCEPIKAQVHADMQGIRNLLRARNPYQNAFAEKVLRTNFHATYPPRDFSTK